MQVSNEEDSVWLEWSVHVEGGVCTWRVECARGGWSVHVEGGVCTWRVRCLDAFS